VVVNTCPGGCGRIVDTCAVAAVDKPPAVGRLGGGHAVRRLIHSELKGCADPFPRRLLALGDAQGAALAASAVESMQSCGVRYDTNATMSLPFAGRKAG
jgi:hypothetical protein